MEGGRRIRYEKKIADEISYEGDLTLRYMFVEFLLNTLSSYNKILVINSRNRTTKIPLQDIRDCGFHYDTFWCKLINHDINYCEFKYPDFKIEDSDNDE